MQVGTGTLTSCSDISSHVLGERMEMCGPTSVQTNQLGQWWRSAQAGNAASMQEYTLCLSPLLLLWLCCTPKKKSAICLLSHRIHASVSFSRAAVWRRACEIRIPLRMHRSYLVKIKTPVCLLLSLPLLLHPPFPGRVTLGSTQKGATMITFCPGGLKQSPCLRSHSQGNCRIFLGWTHKRCYNSYKVARLIISQWYVLN